MAPGDESLNPSKYSILRTFEEVVIDGDRLLIGAWSDDTNSHGAGQAHFDLESGDVLDTLS